MKKAYLKSFIRGLFFLGIFVFVMITGVSMDLDRLYTRGLSWDKFNRVLLPLDMMHIGCKMGSNLFAQNNLALAGNYDSFFLKASSENLHKDLMVATIQAIAYSPALSESENGEEREEVKELPVIVEEKNENTEKIYYKFPDNYKVFLYCTHTAESYIPSSGKAKCEGERGLIDEVARTLAAEINQRGLKTEYINTIHDYPDYSQSYVNSRETVKNIIKTEDKIVGLFDIHRDSIPGVNTGETVEINGKRSARILIIVGTDERKPHPDWKKNLSFAQQIYEEGEKMYPGLIKGVRTKAGTYNQEFHHKALLLEFGSDYNTLEEVLYAASLFADILINVLQKEG